jgi:hypothetical protein
LQQATLLGSRGKSTSLWLNETSSLWLLYKASWLLRQVSRKWAVASLLWGLWSQEISKRIGLRHGGMLSHEKTCWLGRNVRLLHQWLAIRHLGKGIWGLLLLKINRVWAVAMSIQYSKEDLENVAKFHLFVCGLNIVGCPSSIELKKSLISLPPCLTILASEDEGLSLAGLAKETLGEVTFPFGWDEVVAALMLMFS